MSNDLHEFAIKYYSLFDSKKLNMFTSDSLPTGGFDRYTLGVSFSGIDEYFLEKAKEILAKIEQSTGIGDIFEKHPVAELVGKFPELNSIFAAQELQSHEYYHFLQTLLLPPCYALYKASREMASLKVMIFGFHLQTGGKLRIDEKLSIFEHLELIKDDQIGDYLLRLFNLYKNNTAIVENFFSYSSKNTAIDMVDLMEGSAFVFQKLANHTIAVETFVPDKNSAYKKANEYFKANGGTEDVLFLIVCHLSLKYGILDDGDFMEFMPTPQDIFEHLCKNLSEYEELLSRTHQSIGLFTQRHSLFGKSDQINSGYRENSPDLLAIQKDMDGDELLAAKTLTSVCKRLTSDIEKYFIKVGTKFKVNEIDFEDPRAESIIKRIREDYPSFDSDEFFVLILINHRFSSGFLFKYLPEIKEAKYKGLFSEETDTLMDDNLFRMVADIDSLLTKGVAFCCKEHGFLPIRKMASCQNSAGLNRRVINLTGTNLQGIFE